MIPGRVEEGPLQATWFVLLLYAACALSNTSVTRDWAEVKAVCSAARCAPRLGQTGDAAGNKVCNAFACCICLQHYGYFECVAEAKAIILAARYAPRLGQTGAAAGN